MAEFYPSDFKSIGELSLCGIYSSVVAIGVFDGVHKGHQRLLTELLTMAKELEADPVVMTFFPHPRHLVTDNPPPLLLPPAEKIRLLYRFGAKAVVTVDFTQEFAGLSPTEFLRRCIFSGPVYVKGICVGRKWRFGSRASGNAQFLERKASERGFRFSAVDELCTEQGTVVSSTAIRTAVSQGNSGRRRKCWADAILCSARWKKGIRWPPTSSDSDRQSENQGRRSSSSGSLCRICSFERQTLSGRGKHRHRPDVPEAVWRDCARIEIHILEGFNANLYGHFLELELVDFIRPECVFPNAEELKKQISQDLEKITAVIRERN